ncbi:MAG: thioredoxin [Xanthobacteraceae bacterium]|nr:thioredoxin [Xanthobacteraceae bacterium]
MAKIADDTNSDQVIAEDTTPVLVDFWAPWCKPCQALAPILEEIEAANGQEFGLVKVNVDASESIAARFNVRGVPTLVLLAKDKPAERKVGNVSRATIEDWISASLA